MWIIEKYIKYALIFVAVWAALFVQLNFGCAKTRTYQMQPLYAPEEYFTYRKSWDLADIKTGSIVYYERAYRDIRPDEIDTVGRVIAVEGQRVKIDMGTVYVDGGLLSEPYVSEENKSNEVTEEILVPAGHVYILNDHRKLVSAPDSRNFGPLWAKSIIGIIRKE